MKSGKSLIASLNKNDNTDPENFEELKRDRRIDSISDSDSCSSHDSYCSSHDPSHSESLDMNKSIMILKSNDY